MNGKRELLNKLICALFAERGEKAPAVSDEAKKYLFRALVNVRNPAPASNGLLDLQDKYLQAELREKRITDAESLSPVSDSIYLWRGDIIQLKCDGIVNAANPQMLGCFCPNHGCVDNAVHTFAGIQLRLECAEIMKRRGGEEPVGKAEITGAYNLPCKYVLHTVGPTVCGKLTAAQERQLADCYRSCLVLADKNGLQSLAFCCISTGEYMFPNKRAAEIAVKTVKDYKCETRSGLKVIFNVFKEVDYEIYAKLLGHD